MRLYLVRHGDAVTHDIDPQRPLSDTGRLNAEKMAEYLKGIDVNMAEVWHSKKLRAKETAEIFADILGGEKMIRREKHGLSPDDPIGGIASEISGEKKDLMIVGHLPFLDKLACALCEYSKDCGKIIFETAAVVALERADKGAWKLIFSKIPSMI
ncbi:phosphohistidine phosphatase SixA [Elusimicrobiota bacterium]